LFEDKKSGWRVIQHICHPHEIRRFVIVDLNGDWPVIALKSTIRCESSTDRSKIRELCGPVCTEFPQTTPSLWKLNYSIRFDYLFGGNSMAAAITFAALSDPVLRTVSSTHLPASLRWLRVLEPSPPLAASSAAATLAISSSCSAPLSTDRSFRAREARALARLRPFQGANEQ
jgi:hypothetical protein